MGDRYVEEVENPKEVLDEHSSMTMENFVGDVDDEFLCVICFNVMVNPHACKEGHNAFCLHCICRWLANDESCPSGREPLRESELCNQRGMQRLIEKLPMRCPTAVNVEAGAAGAAGGCRWTGVLAEREKHLEECGHVNQLPPDKQANMDSKVRHVALFLN